MNPDDPSPPFDWDTLAMAAQRAPRPDAPPAPHALATRVLALARERGATESLWLSWCLRAACAAVALALILPFVMPTGSDSSLAANASIETEIAELVFAP